MRCGTTVAFRGFGGRPVQGQGAGVRAVGAQDLGEAGDQREGVLVRDRLAVA